MIKVEIEPDARGGYTLRVADGHNDETLLSSTNQSYDGPTFPEALARRLFPRVDVGAFDNDGNDIEPVVLRITYRSGETKTEQLR